MIVLSLKLSRFRQTLRPSRITSHHSWPQNSKVNLVSLQDAEDIHCYHFRIQSFYSSLCFALILCLKV